jgi:hypothetical protein
MMCEHVYKNLGPGICQLCGSESHNVDWKKQNILKEAWHKENPDAKYEGWMSI